MQVCRPLAIYLHLSDNVCISAGQIRNWAGLLYTGNGYSFTTR